MFKCPIGRRTTSWPDFDSEAHIINRTGRTRPQPARLNKSAVAHEFVCSCGHSGWSIHPDVPLLPLVGETDG